MNSFRKLKKVIKSETDILKDIEKEITEFMSDIDGIIFDNNDPKFAGRIQIKIKKGTTINISKIKQLNKYFNQDGVLYVPKENDIFLILYDMNLLGES